MRKIVLDTNCLVQIVPHRSPYNLIWQKILRGEIVLCVTTDILNEYSEVLSRLSTPAFSQLVVEIIGTHKLTQFITTYYHFNLITQDPDDNKFVDCAIAANADCLVSDDAHFRVLHTISFPKLSVITLDAFMKLL